MVDIIPFNPDSVLHAGHHYTHYEPLRLHIRVTVLDKRLKRVVGLPL